MTSGKALEPSGFDVVVPTPTYWLCWALVVLVHSATFAFAMLIGAVHLILSLPVVHVNTVGVAVSIAFERVAGVSYVAAASFHLRAVVKILAASIGRRGVHLQLDWSHMKRQRGLEPPATTTSCGRRMVRMLRRAYASVMGPTGFFSVRSDWFPTVLIAREAFEVFLQSYQAWAMSFSVTTQWINSLAVATVALNCWSIPIVDALPSRNESVRRIRHVLADLVLDFTCTVVIPVCIMMRYLLDFDWATMRFPYALIRDDVWFANAISEGKQVLVTSPLDYVSSLLPLYSTYRALRILSSLITRGSSSPSRASIVPAVPVTPTADGTVHRHQQRPWRRRFIAVVTTFMCVWGVVLVGIHIHAHALARQLENPGCRLYARTWLATNVTCSVQHIHCYRLGIAGTEDQVASVLQGLERSVLIKLTILHCPALSIPRELNEFRSINRIEVINSTLVSWPRSAALREATHPGLTALIFRTVDAPQLPDAIVHRELPRNLMYLVFVNGTLATLPEDLGELWASSGVVHFVLDWNRLRSVPASFRYLRLQGLWLTSNQIDELPERVFEQATIRSLRLSGNPLTSLPSALATSALYELLVEHTNIQSVPTRTETWLKAHPKAIRLGTASLFGSPVCRTTFVIATACSHDWHSQLSAITNKSVEILYPL